MCLRIWGYLMEYASNVNNRASQERNEELESLGVWLALLSLSLVSHSLSFPLLLSMHLLPSPLFADQLIWLLFVCGPQSFLVDILIAVSGFIF